MALTRSHDNAVAEYCFDSAEVRHAFGDPGLIRLTSPNVARPVSASMLFRQSQWHRRLEAAWGKVEKSGRMTVAAGHGKRLSRNAFRPDRQVMETGSISTLDHVDGVQLRIVSFGFGMVPLRPPTSSWTSVSGSAAHTSPHRRAN